MNALQTAPIAALGSWSRAGLELPEQTTFDEWIAVGRQLRSVEQSMMWWIGDWLRFGERKYGEMYAQAEAETGFSYQTLANAKWVAERYESSLRRENLSFTHHKEAASLPALERAAVLDDAGNSGWSVAALRMEVQRRKAVASPPLRPRGESALTFAVRCVARLLGAVFDLDPSSFVGESKGGPDQVHARQVLIYLLITEGGFEQLAVAEAIGRHHSTAWHAMQVVTDMRDDPDIDDAFNRLGEMYRELKAIHERVPALVDALAP